MATVSNMANLIAWIICQFAMVSLFKKVALPIAMLTEEGYLDHGCLKTWHIRCPPEAALAILQQMDRELVMPSEISFNCALGFYKIYALFFMANDYNIIGILNLSERLRLPARGICIVVSCRFGIPSGF